MSRAFTSERDGWCFCSLKKDECMFAKEDGQCALSQCKFGLKKEEEKKDSTKEQKS